MSKDIRIIQYGLGPIGSAAARLIVERAGLTLVAGVDVNPDKIGKDVGDVIGLDQPLGVAVTGTLTQSLEKTSADLVVHTTNSYFDLFKDELIEILDAGLEIVSTSEELSFPWLAHPEEAARIDAVAKGAGKTVLGTGVNPGYLMDTLPLSLTAICQQVDYINVTRVINASRRRKGFQAKIGSGMTKEDFQERMDSGRMGHVGLPESMGMIFETLNKRFERYEECIEPILADRLVETDYFQVQPGRVIGLKQVAHGYSDQGEFLTLTFIAALGALNEGDTITITGKPDLEVKLQGTNGDIATAAIAVNAIPPVIAAPPGLLTMRDLPLITAW